MRPHVSINVQNVAESVIFYEKMFGVKPQKQTDNYAKFDLQKPALNFSMQTGKEVSQVNHFGIEVDSADAVKLWEELFITRGLITQPEEQTECCFAIQDKVWVKILMAIHGKFFTSISNCNLRINQHVHQVRISLAKSVAREEE